jgi:hypothetical protein
MIAHNQGASTMSRTKLFIGLALAAAVIPSMAMADEASPDGWNWKVAPMYLWAPSIKTDLRADQPPVQSDTSFSDIVSKISGVFTGHVEGQGDQFGMFADVMYLSLSDSKDFTRVSTDSSVKTTFFELAGVWSPGENRFEGFEGFAGLRYISGKVDVKFDPVNSLLPNARLTLDKSYSDFMIGGRYNAVLSDRWSMTLRGDTSFGGTDGIWNTSVMFQYHRSEKGAWVIGYRYMDAKLKTPGEAIEMKMLGPVFGYAFSF